MIICIFKFILSIQVQSLHLYLFMILELDVHVCSVVNEIYTVHVIGHQESGLQPAATGKAK